MKQSFLSICLILFALPSWGESYLCTIDKMVETYDSFSSEYKASKQMSGDSFGFSISNNKVKFTDKGWFVADILNIDSKSSDNSYFVASNSKNLFKFQVFQILG